MCWSLEFGKDLGGVVQCCITFAEMDMNECLFTPGRAQMVDQRSDSTYMYFSGLVSLLGLLT